MAHLELNNWNSPLNIIQMAEAEELDQDTHTEIQV